MTEHRRGEVRAEGRRLLGTPMRYGAEARVLMPNGAQVVERFAAFAFSEYLASGAGTDINLMHDKGITIASTRRTAALGVVELRDSPARLAMMVELPQGDVFDQVIDLVREKATAELSVEFQAQDDQVVGDRRTVLRATLPAVGVVDRGAYPQSVEVRASRKWVRGAMPGWQKIAACRCQGKDCDSVSFDRGAFDESLADPDREVLAVAGNYDAPVASRRRGSLRLTVRDDALRVELLLPDTDGGKAIADAASVAPLYVRPYLDLDRSEYVDEGEPGFKTRRFSRAWLRAIIVGATDAADGLTEAEIVERRGIVTPATPARRRLWL